jgi:hypothetical protein
MYRMSKQPGNEESKRQTIAAYFERITEGMNEEEIAAVKNGYQLGIGNRIADIPVLQQAIPNLGAIILSSIDTGVHDFNSQVLLAQHRLLGDSAEWLQDQVSQGLQLTIDIAMGRSPGVITPSTQKFND